MKKHVFLQNRYLNHTIVLIFEPAFSHQYAKKYLAFFTYIIVCYTVLMCSSLCVMTMFHKQNYAISAIKSEDIT